MGKKKAYKSYKKDNAKLAANIIKVVSCLVVISFVISITFIRDRYFGLVAWDDLNNGLGSHNLTIEEADYYYSIDEYINMRYNRAVEIIDEMEKAGLLTNKYLNYLKDGVNHEYFNNCTIIDYESYQAEADAFMMVCDSLNSMEYDCEPEKCTEDCVFNEYAESYIADEYRENLETAHNNYHKAIQAQCNVFGLTDDEWKYYYELELVSDTDNIESIEVELVYLPVKSLQLNDTMVNWLVRSDMAKKLRDSKTLTIENKEALEYLTLIRDAGMFDETVVEKAMNIAYMLGDELEDYSQDDVIILDITGIADYETYINNKLKEKYSGTNIKESTRYISISVSDRYEGEQIYVLFDVKNCKHKEGLLSFEEGVTDEWKEKITHQLVVDSFWSEMYSEIFGEEHTHEHEVQ